MTSIAITGAAGRMGQRLVALAKQAGDFQVLGAIERPDSDQLARDAGEVAGIGPIGLPITPDGRTHVYHQYTLDVGGARDAILADLREAGIGADVYYPIPVHRQEYIMERGLHADLPVTDAAAARTLALPMFPGLTDAEQGQVIDAVRGAVERHLGPGAGAGVSQSAAGQGVAAR